MFSNGSNFFFLNIPYVIFICYREASNASGTTMWKPYGTPLVFPISSDATITRGDIQLIAHSMLSPMLIPKNSETINGDSLVKLPLKLVDGNNDPIDISVGEEKTIKLSSSSMSVVLFIDWSTELVEKYEMDYVENLPEVFKNGHGMKKSRVEPLSLYTCIEAFLREEPLVPEDMWLVFSITSFHYCLLFIKGSGWVMG